MKQKIKIEVEVNIVSADCRIYARNFDTSEVNDMEDDWENPRMPLVKTDENGEKYWNPIILLDEGRIINWPKGTTARIHYKSVDRNEVTLFDENCNVVGKKYKGYVPDFLCPVDDGWGDYVIMNINGEGIIEDFNPNLDDIFNEEEN